MGGDRPPDAIDAPARAVELGSNVGVEALERLADDRPQEVVLGRDVVVQAAAVHPESLGEVLHRGRVEAALAEELDGGPLELKLARSGDRHRGNPFVRIGRAPCQTNVWWMHRVRAARRRIKGLNRLLSTASESVTR